MRTLAVAGILVLLFCGMALAQEKAGAAASGQLIEVKVNGLVCDFCARALEKVFAKQPQVEIKNIDLTSKLLTLQLKPGQALDDGMIKDLVKRAGYVVESIKRKDAVKQ